MSDELPSGWAWGRLQDLAASQPYSMTDGPFGSNLKSIDYVDSGVRVIRLGNLGVGKFSDIDRAYISEAKFADLAKHEVRPGDLVIAALGDPVGRCCQIPDLGTRSIVKADCIKFTPHDAVERRFLMHALNSPQGRTRAEQMGHGLGRLRINMENMRSLPVPIPPVNEQRRIVAKLEALLARSSRAKGALDAIPALLERFRQSVLAAAFRGDLTGDWREANSDEEPASKLLERIRSERLRRWEEAELERMRTSGKVPRDDRWKDRYDEPVQLDAPALPELPNGWSWAPLDLLLTALRNGIAAKPDRESGLSILRISAVRPMSVDLADVRYLPESDEHLPYLLKEGDLLFTRYNGNADLVGSCAVVRDLQCPTVYPDKLIRGRVVEGHVLPELVAMAASCGASRAFIDEKSKSAAGQVGISGSDLRKVPIPVPPLAEQRVLIDRVNRAFAKAASIDDVARNAVAGIPQMDASIMTKAFRGELVPQDPTDEPASVLLQRIRAARDKPVDDEPGPRTKRRRESKVA